MTSSRSSGTALCSRFHRASELIGRRWTGAIIYLLLRQPCRFATLRGAIPDITDRMLSERLQELEQEEIVLRTVLPEAPVRVEYSLTQKGRGLTSAMDAIAAWAEAWIPLEQAVKASARPTRPAPAKARRSRRKAGARSAALSQR